MDCCYHQHHHRHHQQYISSLQRHYPHHFFAPCHHLPTHPHTPPAQKKIYSLTNHTCTHIYFYSHSHPFHHITLDYYILPGTATSLGITGGMNEWMNERMDRWLIWGGMASLNGLRLASYIFFPNTTPLRSPPPSTTFPFQPATQFRKRGRNGTERNVRWCAVADKTMMVRTHRLEWTYKTLV